MDNQRHLFKFYFLLIISAIILSAPRIIFADRHIETTASELTTETVDFQIEYNKTIKLGEELSLELKTDLLIEPEKIYLVTWKISDGTSLKGLKINHQFTTPGFHTVYVTVNSDKGVWSNTLDVYVYKELILFITDQDRNLSKIGNLINYSQKQGIFLKVIDSPLATSEFLSEDILSKKLLESIEDLKSSEKIVIWTKSDSGLTLISTVKRLAKDTELNFRGKEIIFITDSYLSVIENIAKGIFQTVAPHQIILTRFESLWPLLDAININDFLNRIKERGYNFSIIDQQKKQVSPFNLMAKLVNMMIDRGVPSNAIKLILVLPIIVTVVAFMKQVVGLSTLGVYTPAIITLSFIALDLFNGLIILVILLITGTVSRALLKFYRLLYIPRMSILLTIVSIAIFFLYFIGAYVNRIELLSISIFPILVMGTLVEKFVSIQSDKGFKTALLLMIETLIVSISAYFVAQSNLIKTTMLGHPELVFLFLIINILLGKWTGLRLFEYWRFRELLRHAEEE